MKKMVRFFFLSFLMIMIIGGAPSSEDITGNMVLSKKTAQYQAERPFRLTEPVGDVITDLEAFIPVFMAQEGIPGLAITLIRDGDPVWTKGFGVKNSLTRDPVTSETLFEVASNSKVVTAYIALRLVDQGLLSLDAPLNAYLEEPWLPPSDYRDQITLRHVLSHTSGFGHLTFSRDNLFPPGRGYSYSAIGFMYLQEVIEEVTGKSLEEVAQELVFGPLQMETSSFLNRAENKPQTSSGHLPAGLLLLLYLIPSLVVFLVFSLIGVLVSRIWTGRWKPRQRFMVGVFLITLLVASLALLIFFYELDYQKYGWGIVMSGLLVIAIFAILYRLGVWVLNARYSNRTFIRKLLMPLWVLFLLVGIGYLTLTIASVPLPKNIPMQAGAAGTVHATAKDLSKFLVEIANPKYLSDETAAELRTPQVELSPDLSWGLGPGIQHSEDGDALWQWGQLFDFQSVMVIYPEAGCGVVVLTNSDSLNSDVAIRVAHRALGGKIEPLRQATHLAFNYRED